MKRIGIVGVGKWSSQLREAFMREGCVVVAHARKSEVPHPCSGPLVSIEEMVRMEDVDFVIAAADPETTTRTVELCAEWCKPVVATKPLLRHPSVFARSIVVDFWRLFSVPWVKFGMACRPGRSTDWTISVRFVGDGPVREFSGLLDYGPHVLAFLYDLKPADGRIKNVSFVETPTGTICVGSSKEGDALVEFGNGSTERDCKVVYTIRSLGVAETHTFEDSEGILTYTAPNGEKLRQEKIAALRAFARHAIETVRDKSACETYLYSAQAADALDRILAEQARQLDEPAARQPVQDPPGNPVPDQD